MAATFEHPGAQTDRQYSSFMIELVIDGVIMFFVMYAMIDTAGHLYLNTNNFYMTLMMVTPMALIMLIFMRSMFPDKRMNRILYAGAIVIFVLSTWAMRTQALVGDEQFLRAMIPHHSGAVLMCERAELSDPEIIELCKTIVEGQKREINQMQEILHRIK